MDDIELRARFRNSFREVKMTKYMVWFFFFIGLVVLSFSVSVVFIAAMFDAAFSGVQFLSGLVFVMILNIATVALLIDCILTIIRCDAKMNRTTAWVKYNLPIKQIDWHLEPKGEP